jgi:hypothetical protein
VSRSGGLIHVNRNVARRISRLGTLSRQLLLDLFDVLHFGALPDAQVGLYAALLKDPVQISTMVRNLPFIKALRLRDRSLGTGRDSVEPKLLGGLFLLAGE